MTASWVLCAFMAASIASPVPAAPPKAPAHPLVETIHGREVSDPYRWLEDWSAPGVQAWSATQTAYARAMLDRLPEVSAVRQELKTLVEEESGDRALYATSAGTHLFVLRRLRGKQQPVLTREDPLGRVPAFTVYDPSVVAGATELARSIDWFVPSPDGTRVAVAISEGGSERGALHIFNARDGTLVEAAIPNIHNATAGGDVAWSPDGSGIFYTRYPRPGDVSETEQGFFQKLYFHRIGDPPSQDRLELGGDFSRVAEIRLEASSTGRLLAIVQDGDSGNFALYLRERNGAWQQLSQFSDPYFHALFGKADDIFVLSYGAAGRGEVLRITAGETLVGAKVIVPQFKDAALTHSFYSHTTPTALWAGERLNLIYEAGGPTRLRAFDREGRELPAPRQPAVASITGLAKGPHESVLFAVETFTTQTLWQLTDDQERLAPSGLNPLRAEAWKEVKVSREEAISADGTKIPLTILRGPTASARNAPAVITAYGGFGSSVPPRFEKSWRTLLSRGLIIVIANLRGGSEFGRDWHRQAILTNRQRAFDDFRTVISHVHSKGYTTARRTGIMGASNGGLLMGVAITQFPELVSAVVADVGLYDMVRAEKDANGFFNIPEYGSAADPAQFAALLAYSPYHNIRPGRPYPATLFTTGANDPRVNPMHSRKMVAALQAAADPETPVLLRANEGVGHGSGTPLALQIEEKSDAYGFLLSRISR